MKLLAIAVAVVQSGGDKGRQVSFHSNYNIEDYSITNKTETITVKLSKTPETQRRLEEAANPTAGPTETPVSSAEPASEPASPVAPVTPVAPVELEVPAPDWYSASSEPDISY